MGNCIPNKVEEVEEVVKEEIVNVDLPKDLHYEIMNNYEVNVLAKWALVSKGHYEIVKNILAKRKDHIGYDDDSRKYYKIYFNDIPTFNDDYPVSQDKIKKIILTRFNIALTSMNPHRICDSMLNMLMSAFVTILYHQRSNIYYGYTLGFWDEVRVMVNLYHKWKVDDPITEDVICGLLKYHHPYTYQHDVEICDLVKKLFTKCHWTR